MAFHSAEISINTSDKGSQSDGVPRGDISSGCSFPPTAVFTKATYEERNAKRIASNEKPRKRMKIIDETLLPPEEAEKLLAKRAYNRESANRARYRGKQIVEELNKNVRELEEDKIELRRSLKKMEKLVESLKVQNEKLQSKVTQLSCCASTSYAAPGFVSLPTTSYSAADILQPLKQQNSELMTPSFSPLASSLALNQRLNQKISTSSATFEYLKLLHNLNRK